MAVLDPAAEAYRGKVHRGRVRALADAVRAIPARSHADLRLKVLYLWPGNIEGQTVGEDLSETLRSFHNDVMRLGSEPEPDDSDDADASVFQTVRLPPVADLLSNAILKAWAAYAALHDDVTDEGEAAFERARARRDDLIGAAERLPARKESLHATFGLRTARSGYTQGGCHLIPLTLLLVVMASCAAAASAPHLARYRRTMVAGL